MQTRLYVGFVFLEILISNGLMAMLLFGLVLFFLGGLFFYVLYTLKGMEARIRAPLQSELAHQAEELRQARSVSNARELFLAALSHELRTPLSGISGAVQLLQKTGLDARQQEYARMISYANATLLEVVDDMLTFSRIQADKIHTERVPFSIKEIIDDMLSLQTMQAQARGIVMIRDIATDTPDIVLGDRGKLNQILLNIIGNAIKFTDEGSVTVSVQKHHAPDTAKVRLSFSVDDTGIGIPAHELNDVFTPFAQGVDTHQHRRGGTGLGLAICQRLIESMEGSIQIKSVVGEGSCVTFTLDFESVDGITGAELASTVAQDAVVARSMTVLIVEDDEINRLICTRYLAIEGHHPLVAADARQVLHIMNSISSVPDAILMDMNLPGITGVDLATEIRGYKQGSWAHVPVLIMSADVSGTAQDGAKQGRMAGFLAKPFTAEQLSRALGALTLFGGIDAPVIAAPQADTVALLEPTVSLLDLDYLNEEISSLGVDTLIELLNIFRAGVATRIFQMMAQSGRLDWGAVGDGAHQLQGSASNLGMVRVTRMARALYTHIRTASVLTSSHVEQQISELEECCHASCDALRVHLLSGRF